jgi:hypothetical protein
MIEPLNVDEWHEIAGYLLTTPRAKIDETGMIWTLDADGHVTGGMHPRMFLDIMRVEPV